MLCSFAEEKRKRELQNQGIRVEQVPVGVGDGRPDMTQIARRLGTMEITSLMVEGGAMINGAALASGIVDKVFLYYAPKILAGTGFGALCHRPRLRPHERGGLRQGDPAAPLRRRLCGRGIFARPVRGLKRSASIADWHISD